MDNNAGIPDAADREIRKTRAVTLAVTAAVLLLFVVIPIVLMYDVYSTLHSESDGAGDVRLLESCTSPSGKYTVELYLWNGGATTAWGISGYLSDNEKGGERVRIYFEYDTDTVSAAWQNEHEIRINGKTLDVRHDTYESHSGRQRRLTAAHP